MKPERHRRVRPCVYAALGCFILSLALPALQMVVLDSDVTVFGWRAWCMGFVGGVLALKAMATEPLASSMLLLPFFAALLNLNFLAAAARVHGFRLPRVCAFGSVPAAGLGLLFALLAPLPDFRTTSLLPGYYVWIVGHCLLLYAAVGGRGDLTSSEGPSYSV